ncbi:MAG: hypothetical protein JWN04_2214 [Myxococcaceae bacterium]|nr:hypothetical protein [Myxococcaceae bacterium]
MQQRLYVEIPFLFVGLFALASAAQADGSESAARLTKYQKICQTDPRVTIGLVQEQTCIGARLFFDETFDGNGRTCGTCHPAANNYTVDPAFIAHLRHDDPLFVSEKNPALRGLEDPELLRRFALFKVNADGFGDDTHPPVMRSVPHTLALATSLNPPPTLQDGGNICIDRTTLPPLARTGWAGDGAANDGTLSDFAGSAIRQHATKALGRVAGVDFSPSSADEDGAIEAFMMRLGRQNELTLEDASLTDQGAELGRVSFLEGPAALCSSCHGEAGANAILGDDESDELTYANFTFNVGTERARLARLNELHVPFDAGFGVHPFDADGDGVKDSFGNGQFNTPPLIEAADTGPFFHTNAASSIEDAIAFYVTDEFAHSPAGGASGGAFAFEPEDIGNLGRFLRVLNAALNTQMAISRSDAALRITREYDGKEHVMESGLLDLAREELADALRVLSGVRHLNVSAQRSLIGAELQLSLAKFVRGRARAELVSNALKMLRSANASLGSGLQMELGDGTLMF